MRYLRYRFAKLIWSPKDRNELHKYWRQPPDHNRPESYLKGKIRSLFLLELVKKYSTIDSKILEIGCNVGRNLNYLFLAGFKNLEGVEINEKALELLKKTYPEMARQTNLYNMPIEQKIIEFRNREFDIVYTLAVLEHIHTDSEWIFPEIVRITKNFLITIEDERSYSSRHFARKYDLIFESLGMIQIEKIHCSKIDGLGSAFFARVFRKRK